MSARLVNDDLLCSSKIIDEADFYTVQVHFNRGWKLLLLGLGQAESFARFMAMVALRRSIPIINDTLLDSTTREVSPMSRISPFLVEILICMSTELVPSIIEPDDFR